MFCALFSVDKDNRAKFMKLSYKIQDMYDFNHCT